ncbi:MAG: hybrid sensor histidine kinase/response regulator [Anaerolineae bacterium]|nr:hybrid sensor histidine kinase/response regulator [Anaerolineae bacterium]
MGLSEQIRQQLINSFKTEQAEHIQKITTGLLGLEKNPPAAERQELLNEIFREAHSLKGAARAVGMTTIESIGHAMEDLLLGAKEGYLSLSPEAHDLLYQALDAVELVIDQVEAGNSAPPTSVLALLAELANAKKELEEKAQSQNGQQVSEVSPDRQMPGKSTKSQPKAKKETPLAAVNDDRPAALAEKENDEQVEEASPAQLVPTPATTPGGQPGLPARPVDETIRVSVSKLDALMAQFSELLGAKIRAEQRLAEVRELQALAADWQKDWLALRSHYNRVMRNGRNGHSGFHGSDNGSLSNKDFVALTNFVTYNQEQLRFLNTQSNALYRQLSNDTMRLSLIINELQEEIKRVRMLPLSTITTTFARMVRDLAREQKKKVNLTIEGSETELDKRVLEQIKDPLIHLLRNAVDHGLEVPTEREKAGKPAEGNVILSASQQGNRIVILVKDDGRGLDLDAIRTSAIRKGLLRMGEADKLSMAEVANLIFNSGLSTSQIITDISGRGVGMDVVRQNVEELHGTLEVDFEPGQGTTFTMTLPLTLASSRGLLVKAGEQTFALPLTSVERMLQIKAGDVASVEGKEAITYQGKPIAVAWLADLLELPPHPCQAEHLTVVIVAVAEKRLGLIVDDLVGEQEVVIKNLGRQLAKVGGIAGATLLGSGEVILVLHVADLIKLAARTRSRSSYATDVEHKEADQRKTILVVDDSITTRTLEKNILEAVGYEVKLATDGREALGVLATDGLPHLIVSDITMPRLDGFELTSRIKNDERYADIPVILVTSLDSPADKARGIEVGADAYIVKSSFDQGNLLDTIEQLV